jgi:predicted GNAT superfamily acetyltransferase
MDTSITAAFGSKSDQDTGDSEIDLEYNPGKISQMDINTSYDDVLNYYKAKIESDNGSILYLCYHGDLDKIKEILPKIENITTIEKAIICALLNKHYQIVDHILHNYHNYHISKSIRIKKILHC